MFVRNLSINQALFEGKGMKFYLLKMKQDLQGNGWIKTFKETDGSWDYSINPDSGKQLPPVLSYAGPLLIVTHVHLWE